VNAPAPAVDPLDLPDPIPDIPVNTPPVAAPESAFDMEAPAASEAIQEAPQPERPPGETDATRRTGGRRVVRRAPQRTGLSLMEELNAIEKASNEDAGTVNENNEPGVPVVEGGPSNVYSQKELEDAITAYAKQRNVKTAVRSMLLGQMPKILDKNTLEMEVDNNVELGFFNEEQQKLVPYLRETLKNTQIRFEVKMVEREKTRKLYLPEEKFKYMAEKNPNLVYLRQKIQTDLE